MPISPDQEDGEIVAPPAAAARHAAGLHGFVAAFDPSQDDWGEYVECLEHYFTANDIDSEDKIRRVGADAVVSPTYIGGLRLASELIRPTVVNFLDVMLRDRDANLRIDEITIPESSPAAGKRVRELGLDKMSNALLMAMRSPSGQWHYNPGEDQEVTAGTVLIFLGSPEDMRGLCDQLGGVVVSKPAAAGA